MNILFYMPSVLIGGVRTVTEVLSDKFTERGHRVVWLLLYRMYKDERDFPDGRDYVYLPSEDLYSPDNVIFYNKLLIDKKIDYVINQAGLFESVRLIDNKPDGVAKVISVLHNNPIMGFKWLFRDCMSLRDNSVKEKFKRIARIVLYPRTRRLVHKSIENQFKLLQAGKSHVVVLSPRYAETLHREAPYLHEVTSIANPATYDHVNTDVEKEKTVLFVGRLDNRSKKVRDLLDIWKRVQRHHPDWKLTIVGEGRDGDSLKAQGARIPNVEFVGYQDPRPYYERASILCMTSIFEGFPMTLTEAMQHGCVPMCYDSFPAVFDIINDGHDGEIIPSFDRREYARRLIHLMEDREYRDRLAANGRQSIKRYAVDNIVDQWENLFNNLKNKTNV